LFCKSRDEVINKTFKILRDLEEGAKHLPSIPKKNTAESVTAYHKAVDKWAEDYVYTHDGLLDNLPFF
jgi:hypothetical protein